MSFGRWYPSAIGLPDGRILVASGEGEDGARTQPIEIYDLQGGWQVLPASANRLSAVVSKTATPSRRTGRVHRLGGATAVLDVAQAAWSETELSLGPFGLWAAAMGSRHFRLLRRNGWRSGPHGAQEIFARPS
jgi:hypothetical protein